MSPIGKAACWDCTGSRCWALLYYWLVGPIVCVRGCHATRTSPVKAGPYCSSNRIPARSGKSKVEDIAVKGMRGREFVSRNSGYQGHSPGIGRAVNDELPPLRYAEVGGLSG